MNLIVSTAAGGRILVAILWLGVANAAEVGSSTTATCADSKSDFSGIPALTYATVTGDAANKDEANDRLYFYSQHPSKCAALATGACKGTAYLVPGDTVAIGASCNGWDYVQYLGKRRVTVGWMEDGRLGSRKAVKDAQRLEDSDRDGQGAYHFKLTKGRGTPICEAYLQRLNQTAYDDHPYCGLPENNQVPGFTKLNRVYLSTDRINDLHAAVDGFLTNSPPSHYYRPQKDGTLVLPSAKNPVFPPKSRRSTWSYDPPVDIDNDGTPDDRLLIWNTDDRDKSTCGSQFGRTERFARQFSEAIFLTADGNAVDKDKTAKVFGQSVNAARTPQDKNVFRPFGSSYGVFQYKGNVYFETFFDPSYIAGVDGIPNTDPKLQDTLAIFLHKKGVTRQMCHYYAKQ